MEIDAHQNAFIEITSEKYVKKQYQINTLLKQISKENKHEVNILTNIRNWGLSVELVGFLLPSAIGQTSLLYTSNIMSNEFTVHNKICIDYILSNKKVEKEKFQLIDKTEELFLYKYEN